MARGKKSELAPLNLDPAGFADAVANGDIKTVDLSVTVDKEADGKTPVKTTVKALQAVTDAGILLLLSDTGHLRRAANRYIQAEYATRARKANQPFEKQFADSISALMAAKGISKPEAIERLKSVLA